MSITSQIELPPTSMVRVRDLLVTSENYHVDPLSPLRSWCGRIEVSLLSDFSLRANSFAVTRVVLFDTEPLGFPLESIPSEPGVRSHRTKVRSASWTLCLFSLIGCLQARDHEYHRDRVFSSIVPPSHARGPGDDDEFSSAELHALVANRRVPSQHSAATLGDAQLRAVTVLWSVWT